MRLRKIITNDLMQGNFMSFVHDLKQLWNGIPLMLLDKVAPLLSDSALIKLKWKLCMDYPLNLDNPKTFNEKIQWLKLHDRKPVYTTMVDKYEAKKYVADIIGEEYIIPTIAVYDRVEDIDFDKLPNQFVMKCTHDSGGLVICKDKSKLDKDAALKTLNHFLHRRYYYQNREWPYKNVKPRIIVEKFIEDKKTKELRDYKFMCYNGYCKNMFVCTGRDVNDLRVDFFDTKWHHLPFYRKYMNADFSIEQPDNLDKMISLSNKLAKEIKSPFVRIDFYSINKEIYFGEITFFPGSGFECFYPQEWDEKFGEWIKLPNKNC